MRLPCSFNLAFTALAVTAVCIQAFVPTALNRAEVSPSRIASSTTRRFALTNENKQSSSSDAFIEKSFFSSSECDDINTPPSLSILLRSLDQLPSGSDIRGRFVDHSRVGSIANVAHAISSSGSAMPALTPIASHCLGHAFARMLQERSPSSNKLVVALGQDPRPHGKCLCDAFARGIQSVEGVDVHYTGKWWLDVML
jgi:hypothetical protein